MNRKRVGIWLSRRSAAMVGVSPDRRAVSFCHSMARLPNDSAEKVLEKLLTHLPAEWHSSEIRIALSPCYLACCDCFELPFKSESEIETTAAAIIESRCAGETAEDLAIDIRRVASTAGGSRVQAIGIRQTTLAAIRTVVKDALPQSDLKLITGASVVLAQMLSAKGLFILAVSESREAHIVVKNENEVLGWRGFSFEYATPNFEQVLQAEAAQFGAGDVTVCTTQSVSLADNLSVEPAYAVAAAAAVIEPKQVIDVLRGAHDAPKSSIERLRTPLIAACVAVIALCASVGVYFHLQSTVVEQALVDVEKIERKLGHEYLHDAKPDADGLTAQMNKYLAEQIKRQSANRQPSILAFWSEVAQALPNPEQIGLVMESLQLGHEEGRLIGRVSKGQKDVLQNASLLETNLNRSGQLSAHGEFETKESEILVHVRMDYHPQKEVSLNSEAKP